jgi:hypothetical protein
MVNVKRENSSIFLVENSKYIKFFEGQVNGTIPSDVIKKEMKIIFCGMKLIQL